MTKTYEGSGNSEKTFSNGVADIAERHSFTAETDPVETAFPQI
jgi:hypothetical protein